MYSSINYLALSTLVLKIYQCFYSSGIIAFRRNLFYVCVNALYNRYIYFLSKLVNSVISCSELLQFINFHTPKLHSRSCPTYEIPINQTSYDINNPIE